MGTTLTGTQINNTYPAIIKLTDNLSLDGTPKALTDGLGNELTMTVSNVGIDFSGEIDFSSANVSGLPGGSAGLINGAGSNSLKADDSLLSSGSTANGADTIVLGNGSAANNAESVILGASITGDNFTQIGLGQNIYLGGENAHVYGTNTQNNGSSSYSFGNNNNIGAGNQVNVILGGEAVAIPAGTNDYVAIGRVNSPSGNSYNSIQIGLVSSMDNANDTVVIGRGASATNVSSSVAIGRDAAVTASEAVALGVVTQTRANFTGVEELELHTDGGGVIFRSPNGTLYKLTMTDTGDLTVAAV
jgi:hypothetical protein